MPFPQFAPRADWALLRKLAETDGVPLRDLAIQFNVSPTTVNWHARKEGWDCGRARKAKTLLKAAMDGIKTTNANGQCVLVPSRSAQILQLKQADSAVRCTAAVLIQRIVRQLSRTPVDKLLANQDNARWLKIAIESANIVFGWNGAKRAKGEPLNADLFALSPDQLAKLAATEVNATPVSSEVG